MATLYNCPSRVLLAVEHPANVVNIDKGIETLGGPEALRKMADDPSSASLELRFRKEDRFEHPIPSTMAKTSNIVIKVKVDDRVNEKGIPILISEPFAVVRHTVRFRGIADYQWNTKKSKFLNRLEEAITSRDARVLSAFSLNEANDFDPNDLDAPPPPLFSNTTLAHLYGYRQNPAAKRTRTETGIKLVNRSRSIKPRLLVAHFEVQEVPQRPSELLPEKPDESLLGLIADLKQLFEQRPLWTRRALTNTLNQPKTMYIIKFALPYVAYSWKSGPWLDCYTKLGVDPRTDDSYSKYQAVYCTSKSMTTDWETSADGSFNETHKFDGQTLFMKARTFQFVDMTDPILVQIIENAVKRTEPHPKDGWWRSRTMESIRTIIKSKLVSLCNGTVPTDLGFTSILEHFNDPDEPEAESPEDSDGTGEVDDLEERDDLEEQDDLEERDEQITVDPALEQEADPSIPGTLDERIQVLMGSLLKPGEEFDRNPDMAAGERSDFEEDIFGADSD